MSEVPQSDPEHGLRSFEASIAGGSTGRVVEVAQYKDEHGNYWSVIENDTTGERIDIPTTGVEAGMRLEGDHSGKMVDLMGDTGLYMAGVKVGPIETVPNFLKRKGLFTSEVRIDADGNEGVLEPEDSAAEVETAEKPTSAEIDRLGETSLQLIGDILKTAEQDPDLLVALQNVNVFSEVGELSRVLNGGVLESNSARDLQGLLRGLNGSRLKIQSFDTVNTAMREVARQLSKFKDDLLSAARRENDAVSEEEKRRIADIQEAMNQATGLIEGMYNMGESLSSLDGALVRYIDGGTPAQLNGDIDSMCHYFSNFDRAREQFLRMLGSMQEGYRQRLLNRDNAEKSKD